MKPNISKDARWSEPETSQLLELQSLYGNQWTLIASHLKGRTNKEVKTFFYSTMRKCIRIVNTYININRNEPFYNKLKPFP